MEISRVRYENRKKLADGVARMSVEGWMLQKLTTGLDDSVTAEFARQETAPRGQTESSFHCVGKPVRRVPSKK